MHRIKDRKKTITITLRESTTKKLKFKAEQKDISVSALVEEILLKGL